MATKIAVIASTDRGVQLAVTIQRTTQVSLLVSTRQHPELQPIGSIHEFLSEHFSAFDAFVFIGALGICVRSIAPFIQDKQTDPAVVNIDENGNFVQAVTGGHKAGANELAERLAKLISGTPVITTSSDLQQIWSLDTLAEKYKWIPYAEQGMNKAISLFVNNRPTALLLDLRTAGVRFLEKTRPAFVDLFYKYENIDFSRYELFIALTYKNYVSPIPTLYYFVKVLNVGMGCSKDIESNLFLPSFKARLQEQHFALQSVRALGSVDVKKDEQAFHDLAKDLEVPFATFSKEALNAQNVRNPSEVVMEKLGVHSVSEASALLLSGNTDVVLEKLKCTVESGKKFTLAIALDKEAQRKGQIAIVGAGPGDPKLISVKGKELLEEADLVLYAGSLVPDELLLYSKKGASIRDSAGMTLEEQVQLMTEHYTKGHLIVRLQSGDPAIYGAIQEQMTAFDEKGMEYFIVPGISSFQAASACLRSEFTIPELVQSIILTRAEGNTPLPEREKLNEMAKHRATMCIFLSATIAKSVQAQLLEHYPETTPVAVLYRVTWKDEAVYTGQLRDLAQIIRSNKLTRTTLIIVGEAIGARKNRSRLYDPEWKHIFRTGKTRGTNKLTE